MASPGVLTAPRRQPTPSPAAINAEASVQTLELDDGGRRIGAIFELETDHLTPPLIDNGASHVHIASVGCRNVRISIDPVAPIDIEPVSVDQPREHDPVESRRRQDPAWNPCVARSCTSGMGGVSPGGLTTWTCSAGCNHGLVGESLIPGTSVGPHPNEQNGQFGELRPMDSAWSEVEIEFAMLVICTGPCRHGASLGDSRWQLQLLKKRHGAQRRRMRRYFA